MKVYFPPYDQRFLKRFLSKVAVRERNECWNWLGATSDGRGQIWTKGGIKKASRVSYKIFKGPIPKGLLVCHSCDNPLCCNPKHLWLGTNQQNSTDMVVKGRSAKKQNHGTYTHPESRVMGEKNGRSKLHKEDIFKIRLLLIQGKTQKEIALQFNVSQVRISQIKLNKAWKHLGD